MAECCASDQKDLLGSGVALFVWCLPVSMFIVGVLWSEARMWLWVPALLVAGTACIVNAARCGRLHCYITGPLYIVAAGLTALVGFRLTSLPWRWIGAGLLFGTLLAYLLECVLGKFAKSRPHA